MRKVGDSGHDERQTGMCAYCGGATETHDHVPSRVLLDEPFPPDLPWVFSCVGCNNRFSVDEPFLACLVDAAAVLEGRGSVPRRPKLERVLEGSPGLADEVEAALAAGPARALRCDQERLWSVALKLCRGHAYYELNEPQLRDPTTACITPIALLSPVRRKHFETPPRTTVWPELGSRAMHRIIEGHAGWQVVQEGGYRYLASATDTVLVRAVLSEYLALEMTWSD